MSAIPDDWLEQLRAEYPKRYGGQGWAALKRLIPARIAEGCTWDQIIDGTRAYAKWCRHTGKWGTELVKMAQTFYGRNCWFLEVEEYELPEMTRRSTISEPTEQQRKADVLAFENDPLIRKALRNK